jgi:glycosyltransferase involved in cell wall biosynthesis
MAAGTPVIAFKGGGALDYVEPHQTGEFFDYQTPASLANTLEAFDPTLFSSTRISRHAAQFSKQTFRAKMAQFILTHIK